MRFLQKLVRKRPGAEPGNAEENLDDLYCEFCKSFEVRPGVLLMDELRSQGRDELIEWLRPQTPCAIPKSLLRLFVPAARAGHRIWEKEGLSTNYSGNWTEGGGLPPPDSMKALGELATVLDKPVTLYFTKEEDGPFFETRFLP